MYVAVWQHAGYSDRSQQSTTLYWSQDRQQVSTRADTRSSCQDSTSSSDTIVGSY